jgi:hypothetical protein
MNKNLLLPFGFFLTIAFISSQCASLDTASGSLSRLAFSASDSTSALLKSLSTSVSSISESISSGSKEEKESAYRQDIKSALVLFYKHPATQKDLEKDLSLVARDHGITNWKNNANTYRGIGQGLKSANANAKEFESIVERISQNNEKMANLLKEGYLSFN